MAPFFVAQKFGRYVDLFPDAGVLIIGTLRAWLRQGLLRCDPGCMDATATLTGVSDRHFRGQTQTLFVGIPQHQAVSGGVVAGSNPITAAFGQHAGSLSPSGHRQPNWRSRTQPRRPSVVSLFSGGRRGFYLRRALTGRFGVSHRHKLDAVEDVFFVVGAETGDVFGFGFADAPPGKAADDGYPGGSFYLPRPARTCEDRSDYAADQQDGRSEEPPLPRISFSHSLKSFVVRVQLTHRDVLGRNDVARFPLCPVFRRRVARPFVGEGGRFAGRFLGHIHQDSSVGS